MQTIIFISLYYVEHGLGEAKNIEVRTKIEEERRRIREIR